MGVIRRKNLIFVIEIAVIWNQLCDCDVLCELESTKIVIPTIL